MNKYSVLLMCQALEVHRSGFYGWLTRPESSRAQEDARLLEDIKQFWLESGCAYGYCNIQRDLKDAGKKIGKNSLSTDINIIKDLKLALVSFPMILFKKRTRMFLLYRLLSQKCNK